VIVVVLPLESDPALQGPDEVPEVELAGRTHAAEDRLPGSQNKFPLEDRVTVDGREAEGLSGERGRVSTARRASP
jgi:hypothetical protein